VELLFESPTGIVPIEIKLGATIQQSAWKEIDHYRNLNAAAQPGMLICGATARQQRSSGLQV